MHKHKIKQDKIKDRIYFIQQKASHMKGIQINNFFNNHISLNGKKNPTKQPNIFSQPPRPQPILFNYHDQEPDQVASYDALTPQMKSFGKEPAISTRKKRTNTIEPVAKLKDNKKMKVKKSFSQEKFRKTVSMDRCNEKDISEQQDVSKTLNKHNKKPKTSKNKNQQLEGVKRSKSAIIKNTHSKTIEPKQISRHFLKQPKKNNIISADNSFKDTSKKQIKKQTQNLINKKEHIEKFQCKTARVQSTKVKSRKNKDKIIGEINKSAEKDDKKFLKFLTERKTTGVTASKSYLTSAKQSKPNSARERKPSKKLFDSKQKDLYRIEDQDVNTYRNLEEFIKDSAKQENQEVKQTLNELQSVLQGISSKKDLAKELKKFTFKLKQYPSKNNSDQNQSSLSEEEESNSEAFKRIKDFKNNLVKKKLNEAKQISKQQQVQSHRQQIPSNKKSSKKLLKAKKKLQDPQKHLKKQVKIQNLDSNEGQMLQSSNPNNETSEPQAFKNTEQQESKYINSRNVSQFYQMGNKQQPHNNLPQAMDSDQDLQDIALDAQNKKYIQFLKNLQAECQNDSSNDIKQKNRSNSDGEKNDNLIDDINTYLNRQYVQVSKQYNSQTRNDSYQPEHIANPLLERRKFQPYPVQSIDREHIHSGCLNFYNNQEQEDHRLSSNQNYQVSNQIINKLSQIQQLKSFQKQSDQMMTKVGLNPKLQQKKKNLTIQLNQNISKIAQIKSTENKTPSSPKYDDRYPHMVKSPKFSDVQITNILAAKQKCLASKHQKMNELVQRMYEKELVSPKSYEYYVYQLKKQYEEESEGFDGFKEQASEILNEINQQKNDIKAIDELIREERWQEARKLMKGDHKAASAFFGFKKSKEKVFETYDSKHKQQKVFEANESKHKPELVKQTLVQIEISPTKKRNVAVVQNNINITIKPQVSANQQIKEQQIKEEDKRAAVELNKKQENRQQKKSVKTRQRLIRQARNIQYYSSSQQYEQDSTPQMQQSITKPLQYDFAQQYMLKSNQNELGVGDKFAPQTKLQSQLDSYLNADKAESQDFQHYVYYHSESNEDPLVSEHSKEENKIPEYTHQQDNKNAEYTQKLKPQSIFKLFEVPLTGDDDNDDNEKHKKDDTDSDGSDKYQRVILQTQDNTNKHNKVIKIDEHQPANQQDLEQVVTTPNKSSQRNQKSVQQDNLSENGSILELQLRKGFESNLFFIKEYCISLCEYIRDNPELKNQFKHDITQPLRFDTQNLLKNYRKALNGSYSQDYNSAVTPLQYKHEFRKPPNKAISLDLANSFNKSYGPLKFCNKDLTKKGREKFNMEKQAQKIFLSAILQVLNESLDFERPGSIFGKPLAWANKSKHLKNMKYLHGQKTKKVAQDSEQSAETYDFIFGVAIARIIQWGSCLCGFLPDTAELENTEIDDDYVVHIRETRMAFLLEKMLAEQEATFNNSELQETQIMLLMGKMICEELVNQAVQEIASLRSQDTFIYCAE